MKLQDLVFTDGIATLATPSDGVLRIVANNDLSYSASLHYDCEITNLGYSMATSSLDVILSDLFNKDGQGMGQEVKTPEKGLNLSQSGMKYDAGKTDPSLILNGMPRALLAVAEVATFGAKKYARDSWQTVPNALMRYTAAKDRHRIEGAMAEYDTESCLLHAAHEAWNALAVLELKLRESEIDEMAFKHTLDDTTE